MKGYMELALGAILLVLMYDKPHAFTEFANSLLGKAIMIIVVGIIAKNNGLAAGLLAALIMVILMHDTAEGMTGKKNNEKIVTITPNDADQASIKKLIKKPCGKGKSGAECGYAQTFCDNEVCKIKVSSTPLLENDKATKANHSSGSDIRIAEGFRNREAYQNTIESMKFSNGQTGAGQNIFNQF